MQPLWYYQINIYSLFCIGSSNGDFIWKFIDLNDAYHLASVGTFAVYIYKLLGTFDTSHITLLSAHFR